jgi:hypothetical protein
MTYLIFSDFQSAYIAKAVITLNMRLSGNVTKEWADIRERTTGDFALLYPEEEHMNYVVGYTDTQEYSEDWFTQNIRW